LTPDRLEAVIGSWEDVEELEDASANELEDVDETVEVEEESRNIEEELQGYIFSKNVNYFSR